MNDIILKPILTEKMADLGERLNRYAFEVNSKSNKIEIKNAIENAYGVNVKAVNTMKQGGGKRKMKYTNRGVSFQRTKLIKKAIVTLEEGDTIDLYENI
ncbi:MAG: 50S ribosomal protein L23 [Bacteroidota bacterium]|jgi:large subunit ribosomal protein L23|nr:50S ribosomal protein L23 [Crocinitomicaceae bacterium]MEC7128210.1 50S ribosomal protein L23 [Bacteroidota bacterium]MEC7618521.1 50S ribosomal protein L23 [Bacteroidota bacterium]MEC7945580.1 50S ribosomal protein L23 [Bacteroidota bacterium]MEC8460475.1 50S ribosomal protein L23 [Bacteroidota bacterium]|tara:strand:- start:195 stop:491 length:297 start_codon:yes stop_codon:yes gene_type:complete